MSLLSAHERNLAVYSFNFFLISSVIPHILLYYFMEYFFWYKTKLFINILLENHARSLRFLDIFLVRLLLNAIEYIQSEHQHNLLLIKFIKSCYRDLSILQIIKIVKNYWKKLKYTFKNKNYHFFIILYDVMEIFSELHDKDCKMHKN